MRRIRAWVLRTAGMLTRSRRQREFDEELQAHLEMHVEDNVRAGMTPEQARRQALLALGGVAPLREEYRDRLGLPSLDALWQDVRFGWRMIRRTPAVSLFAVLAIAFGIGINTMVFSLTNAVLYKRLPVPDADTLVFVGTLDARRADVGAMSWPDFTDVRARVRSLSSLAASAPTAADLNDAEGYAEPLNGEEVTVNGFAVAGVRLLLGREFAESDARPGAPPVAILSERVWNRRYGADPNVIGRTVRLNATATTIVGVAAMAPLIAEGHTGVWTPLVPTGRWEDRRWRRLLVFGRLAPGARVESARAEVSAIGAALAREHPDTNKDAPLIAGSFRDQALPQRVRTLFLVMLGAVGLVLLVACANVANLLLARAAGRTREIAIRTAIGATRRRIVRQLLIESLILSTFGGLLGLALAVAGVRAFDSALVDAGRPLWLDFSVDLTVLAYLTAITVATAILFGLAPAWRLAKVETTAVMKEGSPGSGKRQGRIVMSTLVIAEMTLAVVLLAGAGVMIRSFLNVYRVPLGFDHEHLHTFRLNTARYYDSNAERSRLFDDLVTRLESIPGVEAAAVTSNLPLDNWSFDVPIHFSEGPRPLHQASVISILGSYDSALGVPVKQGRFFSAAEAAGPPTVAVVNESFAARSWPGESPLGRQFRIVVNDKPLPWLTVVGVMADVAQRERQLDRPTAYVPYSMRPQTDIGVVVRGNAPAHALSHEIRRTVRAVNPDLPVRELDTFANHFRLRHWPERVFGTLFSVFGAIALLLAVIGLYGVTSYATSQRAHEIGVRVALGATHRDVVRSVASGSAKQVAIALVLGLGGALGLTRLLSTQLVGVAPSDPATFAGVAITLTATAILGCLVPVRRALRINPIAALRHE